MTGNRSRGLQIRLVVFALAAVAVLTAAGVAPALEAGPKLTEPRADRLAALDCYGELADSPRPPALLVPGTITSPEEAWSWGYRKVLLERGHSVCTVRLPEYGFVDVQRSVEYVLSAIRKVGRRSGRRLSIVGHSQGGFQLLFALRVWPRAARFVDDFVGLAGVYDRGTQWAREEIDPSTRTSASRAYCSADCVPSQHQEATGSELLGELAKRRLPAGPSYTAIGTLYDEHVTPQPEANKLPSGRATRSIQIQEICPGRRYPTPGGAFPVNHGGMLGDAIAHALVLDALDHPGPAEPQRISRSVCMKATYDGLDPAGSAVAAAAFGPRSAEPEQQVNREPVLRCNLHPRCEDRRSWARPLLASARLAPPAIRTVHDCPGGCRGPRTATLRTRAHAAGWLMLRFDRFGSGQDAVRAFGGRVRLSKGEGSIRFSARSCRNLDGETRCRALRSGVYRLHLTTKPMHGTYWTRERVLRLRLTRR